MEKRMNNFKCEPASEGTTIDLGSVFHDIGCSLLDKFESDPNNDLAAIWFALGAMNGNKLSQTNLGLLLTEGRGLPENFDLGLSLLRQVADLGDKNAQEAVYFLTIPENEYTCECCRKLKMN